MDTALITYSMDSCLNPKERKIHQTWLPVYKQLSVEQMKSLAASFQFNKKSVEKLINHKNRRFTYIKKGGYEIVKQFHHKPIETILYSDSRQPINKWFQEQSKNIPISDPKYDSC